MAKGGSAPAPTPPGDTAKADFGAETATSGHAIQHGTPNQFSPAGSVTYDKYNLPEVQLGNGQVVPGGQGVSGVHTSFSPEFQGIFDTLVGRGGGLASNLPTGFNPNIDRGALRQAYVNEGLADVQPEWARQDDARNVMMSERGIPIGSEIWANENNRVGEERGGYLKSLTNQAHAAAAADEAQQFAQQLTEHQSDWGDFTNFYNAVQGMQAGLQGRDSPLIASSLNAPDMAGITARYDQARTNNWMAKQQSANAGMGAGISAIGSILPFLFMSDERLKEDIEPVGELHDGQEPLPIYEWSYKGDPERHIGPMAQDLYETNPELVHMHPSGYLAINANAPTRPTLAALLRAGN